MPNSDLVERLEEICGYRFVHKNMALTSLTHASVANHRLESNERLEFLGDAVLGMVVCAELYDRYSDKLEGALTKVKSVVVSRKTCADIADALGLTSLLILGKGMSGRRHVPTSLRAAVFEALIGAVYVDGGFEPARDLILRTTLPYIEQAADSDTFDNYKSVLQQYAQRHLCATPKYLSLDEQGPDHSKSFEVCVVLDNLRFPSAWGPSKKEAEQKAAKIALTKLQNGSFASLEAQQPVYP